MTINSSLARTNYPMQIRFQMFCKKMAVSEAWVDELSRPRARQLPLWVQSSEELNVGIVRDSRVALRSRWRTLSTAPPGKRTGIIWPARAGGERVCRQDLGSVGL